MMVCTTCRRELDPSESSFTENRTGVITCRPCLTIDLTAFDRDDTDPLMDLLDAALREPRPDGLPTPLDDGTQVAGCDAVYFRLPSGQELTVKVNGETGTLVIGHRLCDHPGDVVGRDAWGDIHILPGRPLRQASLDYKPAMPLSGN